MVRLYAAIARPREASSSESRTPPFSNRWLCSLAPPCTKPLFRASPSNLSIRDAIVP